MGRLHAARREQWKSALKVVKHIVWLQLAALEVVPILEEEVGLVGRRHVSAEGEVGDDASPSGDAVGENAPAHAVMLVEALSKSPLVRKHALEPGAEPEAGGQGPLSNRAGQREK